MVKRKLGALEKVEADIANLQYKIRRDPASYREDFINQYRQYEAARDIFLEAPASVSMDGVLSFRESIDLLAHVADCYPDLTATVPNDLATILSAHHATLESELREKIVGSLVLLRKKEIIKSATLLQILFPILVGTPSKTLRALLFTKILSDLRTANSKTIDHQLNRTVQNVLFGLLLDDRVSPKGLWAVKITRELWKRQLWTTSKAVEIMKEASLSENEKIVLGGVRFFLGGDREREELKDESSDEDSALDIGKLKHQAHINKKSKKQARSIEKAVATIKKKRKKSQPHLLNFSALHLLHDPQGFAEELFAKHLQNSRSKLNLEQKLQVLQLVTRLVGLHKLTITSLYSYFLNFVPPDVLEPLVQKIANEFVSEASAAEVASAGLNAIREICVRQPLAMNDTLLQDLIMYRKSKDKGVVMAAKGLLALYREVGAEMLKKRDRGKAAAMGLRSGERKERRFGEEEAGGIEGIELLERWKEDEKKRKMEVDGDAGDQSGGESEDWGAWDVEEQDDSDESGGWINVESDDEINISDDDDEKRGSKTPKAQEPSDTANGIVDPGADAVVSSETRTSTLATSRILTPADLAKLQELRLQAEVNKLTGKKKRKVQENRHIDDPLTAEAIEGLASLSGHATKEAKLAAAAAGKTDRSEHRSRQAVRQEEKQAQGKSSTNREKARKKNFMMTLGKARGKQKRSLREAGKVLRGHVDRAKRGGKRGNVGS
ncbi:MAG: Severe Depolymerization of Actin [Thelocarpon superellum]|nr:MAG: Severe Depolymerization of Actin [Thelocarpon superellum]